LLPTKTKGRPGRFDCALAGELQDVNLAQFTWLRLLAAEHGQIFAPRR
jgi:DNA helicase-2/ATP-dependent DNA helicase PcrA